jgi:hypothetical protein
MLIPLLCCFFVFVFFCFFCFFLGHPCIECVSRGYSMRTLTQCVICWPPQAHQRSFCLPVWLQCNRGVLVPLSSCSPKMAIDGLSIFFLHSKVHYQVRSFLCIQRLGGSAQWMLLKNSTFGNSWRKLLTPVRVTSKHKAISFIY